MNLKWSTEARRSLRAIHKFIAQDSDVYASRMVHRIVEKVEAAARSPLSGHRVHEYPEATLREVHESPYRIIYSFTEDEFQVVTIVHFKQALKRTRLTSR